MRPTAGILALLVIAACGRGPGGPGGAPPAASPSGAPAHYQASQLAGFTVFVHEAVLAHPAEAAAVQARVEGLLAEARALFGGKIRAVEGVQIWVEWAPQDSRTRGAAEFHRSRAWLVANGYNPAKENGIEIDDTRAFLRSTSFDQPLALLHELAHAYEWLALGGAAPGGEDAYQHAAASGRYEAVSRLNGPKVRAYAMTNAREYFAESTEAYFGVNDYWPFTREALREQDPEGYAVQERVWGPAPARPAARQLGCASVGVSTTEGVSTALEIRNLTGRPLDLYWVDPAGARRPYGRVAPGATDIRMTYQGHRWLAAEADGGPCVAAFVAGPRPAWVSLESPR
jgi:hypothetical protein